ncbi:unnamed protein product [Caenorhabditis sp. 36 PRJEB53466]|nr:unnamed protein product [Caenorhabditis sp. 36 PRJEB53466]
MAVNSDMMEKMLKMIEVTQQQMQLQATRHQESIDKLIKSMSSGKINGNPGTVSQSESSVSQSQLINVISGRISQFQFDLETEKTFSRWKMFDVKKSIFSHRFACMNIIRDGDSTVEYTNKVNAMCEAANLDKIDIDGWKVFFWLKGHVNAVRQYVTADINDRSVDYQLDTGSDITLIGKDEWIKIGKPKLESFATRVTSASGDDLKLLGRANVNFTLKGSQASGFVYVREKGNLLGLDWIGKSTEMSYYLGLMVNEVKSPDTETLRAELKRKFPEVFKEGLGRCTKEKAVLTVKPGSSPVFKPKRPVPYGALETVDKELVRLVSLKVLKKVNHSTWAAPLVCVRKADGDTRMCADFKTGLNEALEDEDHPIPTPEDVFATLNGGTVFSTVDLKDAYLQIELAEESKELLTVNTHRGLYQYQRLPFGAKTAPMVFQRIMDKMITGLTGVTAYLDDIIVDQKELRSFMGMITYYSAFIPHMKSLRGPLDKLLMKDCDWIWTQKEAEAFQKLKDVLSSDLNLTHYQPNIPIVVAADACDYGIGAVISHRFADGTEKPIAHAARSLNSAEKNYSQIEKEGLGLIFAVKRFHKYLFGRKFLLRTDHKPLLSIFGSKKGIPVHSQNRLVRWSTILLAYDFVIEYVKTDDFGQADALSRMIQKMPSKNEDMVIAQVEVDVEGSLQSAVRRLPEVIKCISRGVWPKKLEGKLKKFSSIKQSLSVVKDCVMMSERVVVPEMLQKTILKQLHEGHPGMVRMKQLARAFVFWPGMDEDIAKVVAACNTCQIHGKTLRKVPLEPWNTPERVWQRVHIDYAGPENGQYYLVVVDAKSKWPEVAIVKSISSVSTVRTLKGIFSSHGYPETLVSDNGTQFVSREFANMCHEYGIEHIRSPAFHPQSNGQAERFVDTLKRGLKKLKEEGNVNPEIMSQFLFHYRSTPSNALGGLTPAEAHFGRRIRTKMSLLVPMLNKCSDSRPGMKEQFDKHNGVKDRTFDVNDAVFTKIFEHNSWSWIPATVIQRRGRVVYVVSLNDGRERTVHANQLKPRVLENGVSKEDRWRSTMEDIFELSCDGFYFNETVKGKEDTSTTGTRSENARTDVTMQGDTGQPGLPQGASPQGSQSQGSQSQRQQGQGQPSQGHANQGQSGQPHLSQAQGAPEDEEPLRRSGRERKPIVRFDPSNRT